MNFKKDYYTILGLESSCTKEDLKAAYRKLAKQYHPDRMPGADPTRMQEINEAYEVLSNTDKKAIYDEYYHSARNQSKETAENAGTDVATNKTHVRTYERKYTVTETEKVYIRGKMQVKFWAEALHPESVYMSMADYLINAVETTIFIREEDMDARAPSSEYSQSVSESEIFKTPLPQPIRCNILTPAGPVLYMLHLANIRVANIFLKDINKHDNQSLGTLEADVLAELVNTITKEESEWVTECFGPTGNAETKQEDGWHWKREEFYHANCSTYWSAWEKVSPVRKPAAASAYTTGTSKPFANAKAGAGRRWKTSGRAWANKPRDQTDWTLWLALLLLAILFIAVPPFRTVMLMYLAFFLLLGLGGGIIACIGRLMPYVFTLLLAAIVFAGIKGMFRGTTDSRPFVQDKPAYDTLTTKKEVKRRPGREGADTQGYDTIMTHTIRWKDYDSIRYEVNLPVRVSSVRDAERHHVALQYLMPASIAQVYNEMDGYDGAALDLVYQAFDSLRVQHQMSEQQFANALVSCVQSIPYYLVVDRDCTPSLYADEFIRKYLATCNESCCLGGVLYGVRSPVEFLSDLKGDCDTRALFLYSLFRKFNYDVALITSEHYRHAAIAVALTGNVANAASVLRRGNKLFYAWETTARGHRAGNLPLPVSNLKHWNIALINE